MLPLSLTTYQPLSLLAISIHYDEQKVEAATARAAAAAAARHTRKKNAKKRMKHKKAKKKKKKLTLYATKGSEKL